jgi:hypothetical protein
MEPGATGGSIELKEGCDITMEMAGGIYAAVRK